MILFAFSLEKGVVLFLPLTYLISYLICFPSSILDRSEREEKENADLGNAVSPRSGDYYYCGWMDGRCCCRSSKLFSLLLFPLSAGWGLGFFSFSFLFYFFHGVRDLTND